MNSERAMSRIGSIGAVLLLVITGILPSTLYARLANPELVPAKAAYVASVPDLPELWSAWKRNGIYSAFNKHAAELAALPSGADAPQALKFLLRQPYEAEFQAIEKGLQFKLDGDTLARMFKNADVYVKPGERAGQMAWGVIATIGDKEKVQKILDLLEKAAASAAGAAPANSTSDKATSDKESSSSAQNVSPISTELYKGTEIKRFKGQDDQEVLFAQAGNLFLVSNDNREIRALLDRTLKVDAGPLYSSTPAYQTVEKGLAKHPGQLFTYVDESQVMDSESDQRLQVLKGFMKKAGMAELSGAVINVEPKRISVFSCAPLGTKAAGDAQSMLTKNPGTTPLGVISYVPEKALLVYGTSLLDPETVADVLDSLIGLAGGARENVDRQVGAIETQLGFSLKKDLLPALGNEVAFMLNSVSIGAGTLSGVDAALVIKIRNQESMKRVLSGIEKFVSALTQPESGSNTSKSPAAGMKSESADGVTIKYIELPVAPGFSPGFAVDGDYLIIGTQKNSMRNMIRVKAGKANGLTSSEVYKALGPNVTTTGNTFTMFDFNGVWEVAATAAKLLTSSGDVSKLIDALRAVHAYGATTMVRDNALVAYGVLVVD